MYLRCDVFSKNILLYYNFFIILNTKIIKSYCVGAIKLKYDIVENIGIILDKTWLLKILTFND